MKNEQIVQENEYQFPYHYIPVLENGSFRQHFYWSWGFRYLGGMRVARELCFQEHFESLLDLGCGDGRFLKEMRLHTAGQRLVGIDYSERAICLARALNPGTDYRCMNISKAELPDDRFDIVSLIEVIEHIPPDDLPEFISVAANLLQPNGRLVITVPHTNQVVGKKHFQHFNSASLKELLDPHFSEIKFQPFDFPSRVLGLWFRFLGRSGKVFLVTWPPLLKKFHGYYIRNCLIGTDEKKCQRIACVASNCE